MEVLEKIEKLRKERGWSINNLAMEALLTQSTLNNLYARKAEPKLQPCAPFAMLSAFLWRSFSPTTPKKKRRKL